MGSFGPEFWITVAQVSGPAIAVYMGIRLDIARLIVRVDSLTTEVARAHTRIDGFMNSTHK
jgi:hypothetical protein